MTGGPAQGANLADLLERILDKGIVIVGDIRVNLLDIELLTIKLRLLVASVDRAKEMGIDWWEHDPSLSSKAAREQAAASSSERELREENRELRERLAALEARALDAGAPERTGERQQEPAGRARPAGGSSSKQDRKDDGD
nr:gas vesicle protein [Actinomadura macrotermitis]